MRFGSVARPINLRENLMSRSKEEKKDPTQPGRRTFLRIGGLGAAALAAGGARRAEVAPEEALTGQAPPAQGQAPQAPPAQRPCHSSNGISIRCRRPSLR